MHHLRLEAWQLRLLTQLRDPFLQDSRVLLIVTYAEDDSRALYLVDYNAWPIFIKLFS